jgi:alkanesulfonate monooxygenase SsuD/methylene tetrahydromethanopterin reductase-like flavin-dependent oxidoreductase (luciferase family)
MVCEFGLTLAEAATRVDLLHPEALLEEHVRFVEALPPAFSTLWIEDHLQWQAYHFEDVSRPEMLPTVECLTTAAFYAARFPAFKVGTLVLGQGYRNPALTAKMAANLQYLTRGRFILGIGSGWKEDEYRAYGYPYPPRRQRIEELEDAVNILRAMWTSSPASYQGRHYAIEHAYCDPLPAVPIPLLIAGHGERYLLPVVAHYADWWNQCFSTVEEYRHSRDVLHMRCREVGRDPAEIKLTYYGAVAIADEPITESEVIHLVRGTPQEVAQELQEFIDLGVSHLMLRFSNLTSLERFRDETLPRLVTEDR